VSRGRPDKNLGYRDVPLDEVIACHLLWTTGVGLSGEPSCSATLAAMEARRRERPEAATVHDLDYRPMLWNSLDEARWRSGRCAARPWWSATPRRCRWPRVPPTPSAVRALLDRGVQVAIVKRGGEGLLARTAPGESIEVPPIAVEVKNGLGAGDSFGGALCHGLVSDWELERTLRFANAAGAIVASRMRCSVDMPASSEVEELLAERSTNS
jgi:5-dehydro-2-deoxygluconokinase